MEAAAADMDEIIAGLKNATLEKSPERALPLLKQISDAENNLCDKYDIKGDLLELLGLDDRAVQVQVARCIAEVAKTEAQRDKFTKEDVIGKLVSLLSNEIPRLELTIQVCRALGNICYANDDARSIIKNTKGDERIFALLDLDVDTDDEDKDQFVRVRCGLVSNYLLGSDDIAERAVELKIVTKIEKILNRCVADVDKYEDLLLNILPPLSILTEQISELYFEPTLNKLIAQILAKCTNPDLAESCLALLHFSAQNDDVKLLLAEEGLCETIYKLLEKYKNFANTDEARVLMKLACDLIVLILTGVHGRLAGLVGRGAAHHRCPRPRELCPHRPALHLHGREPNYAQAARNSRKEQRRRPSDDAAARPAEHAEEFGDTKTEQGRRGRGRTGGHYSAHAGDPPAAGGVQAARNAPDDRRWTRKIGPATVAK